MLTIAFVTVVALGLALTLAMHISQGALLRPGAPAPSARPPAVSILRPLEGLDENHGRRCRA